jgi:pimeloyl-ACP methyl ester carboxylesterase
MVKKTPLVLLSGLLLDRRLWSPQLAALADIAEMTVPNLGRDDSFAGMARRVLDAAPPRFALAGLSMGGYLAIEIAREAPERVTHLALLDSSARADRPEQSQRRRDLIALSERGQFRGVTPRLMPQLIHRDRLGDKNLTDVIYAMADAVGPEGFRRQETAIMNRRDMRPDLARVAAPTLVLCGRDDALTPPKLAEEMAALIPRSRLVIVEGCGHLSTLERPAEVNAAMREWLTD